MKQIVVAAALLFSIALPVAAKPSTVPPHHFYQTKSQFHFYTTSTDEVATLSHDPN